MKNLIYLTTFIFLVVFLTSCSKDDATQSGTATLKISAGFKNSTTGKQSASKMASDINFTEGHIKIVEIVFDGTLVTGDSTSRTLAISSTIDFKTGVANPVLEMEIPAGTYSDLNLGIELRDEDSLPSIVMEGTFTRNGGEVVPIKFEFNSGEVFEAESTQEVTVSMDRDVLSIIVFDPDVWFSVVPDIALDNASLTDGVIFIDETLKDGVIVISETSNAAIFDLVADRLDISTQAVFN